MTGVQTCALPISLIKAGADSHSLVYSKDSSLRRRLRVCKNHLGNIKRFDRYNKVPSED